MFNDAENSYLDALDEKEKEKGSKRKYDNLLLVKLGAQRVTPYFPSVKDENGKKVVDAEGRTVKSKEQAGWMYILTEYITSEAVRVVLPTKLNIKRGLYSVTGYGYGNDYSSKFIEDVERDKEGKLMFKHISLKQK